MKHIDCVAQGKITLVFSRLHLLHKYSTCKAEHITCGDRINHVQGSNIINIYMQGFFGKECADGLLVQLSYQWIGSETTRPKREAI